jgi:hypothetical protein
MTDSLKTVFDAFGLALSLPERLVRTLASAVGGATKLLTDTMLPEPLRNTSLFRALVGNTQRFIIEKVAEVQGAYAQEEAAALPENYVARKLAGNLLDLAGIFSLHLSPLWVFAVVADLAEGSKSYLDRLVKELKDQHVLGPDANIASVDQLLESIGQAGKNTAQVFDAPPVDVEQVRTLRDSLAKGYGAVFTNATAFLPRVDDLWRRIESLASRDNVSAQSLAGLLTLDLEKTAGKAVGAAFALGKATGDALSETVFDSYARSLERISQQGAVACLEEAVGPFARAIQSHLTGQGQTWTQRAWGKLTAPFLQPRDADAPTMREEIGRAEGERPPS